MTFERELPASEWHKLEGIYRSQGDVLPSAEQNRAIVSESDSKIVGVCGINLVAHIGPLWVDPDCRGQGVAHRMTAAAEQLLRQLGGKGYLMFPSNQASCRVAEKMALEVMDWKVYRKEF